MGVRTNAPLAQFKTVLMKHSTPTYAGGQTEGPLHLTEDVQVGDQLQAATDNKAKDDEFLEENKSGDSGTVFAEDCPTYSAAD